MKPVFKCEYCTFMGTEDEVYKHEQEECIANYTKKSCTTCAHREVYFPKEMRGLTMYYKCKCEIEIPEGKMMVNCKSYERKEKDFIDNIFDGLFGGT